MAVVDFGFDKKPDVQYNWRECCYGILKRDDEFALVFSHKDQNYSIAGGGMEQGETEQQALTREFLEETGMTVTNSKKLIDVVSRGRKKNGEYLEQLSHVFMVDVAEQIQKPIEDWHEVVWVKSKDVVSMVSNRWQKVLFENYLLNNQTGE